MVQILPVLRVPILGLLLCLSAALGQEIRSEEIQTSTILQDEVVTEMSETTLLPESTEAADAPTIMQTPEKFETVVLWHEAVDSKETNINETIHLNPSDVQCIKINLLSKKVSGVTLGESCIRLYENDQCTGRTRELAKNGASSDCALNLQNCGFDNIAASVSLCEYNKDNHILEEASSNGVCKEPCGKRGWRYSWCELEDGNWDYCSEKAGLDYLGNKCEKPCRKDGYSYNWCEVENGSWGYCSHPMMQHE